MTERWALVTGATRGIGWSVAERLCRDGLGIIATGRDEERLKALSLLLADAGGVVETLVADLEQPDEVDRLAEALLSRGGPIGAIVNNAGVLVAARYPEISAEMWRSSLQVNLNAPLALVHQLYRQIPRGGSIVNVGSILGIRASRSVMPYMVAKGALHHATRALALELSPFGIRANAVAPGFISTDMFEDAHTADAKERLARAHPLGRVGTTVDVAGVVSFLCSDDASFVTGVVLPVDGGLAASMAIPDLEGSEHA